MFNDWMPFLTPTLLSLEPIMDSMISILIVICVIYFSLWTVNIIITIVSVLDSLFLSQEYCYCYRFLVSACYSKAKVAAACAGILYFISYVPYMYVAIREEAAGDKISAAVKSLVVSVLFTYLN